MIESCVFIANQIRNLIGGDYGNKNPMVNLVRFMME